jgi:hypothetical protein
MTLSVGIFLPLLLRFEHLGQRFSIRRVVRVCFIIPHAEPGASGFTA